MKNILIVDDHAVNRKLLNAMLTNAGYLTDEAGSGEEAIEKVTAGGFDLILLDVVMPGRNGLEIMPDLKRLSPGVKIIIITAFATVEIAKEAIRKGANDFISKPYREKELLITIKRVIEEAAFEKSIEKSAFDQTLVAMSNPLRRGILKVLASHGKMQLFKLVEALGTAEHTKTLFHLKALKFSGFIGQDNEKVYFIVKKGERALECLKSLEYFLKDI